MSKYGIRVSLRPARIPDYEDVRLDIKPKVAKTTIRLTAEDRALAKRLANHEGVSVSDVVRMGLRELAKARGVK